ncbi:MAG: ankyrin repeat domain-containing protein, partial [Gammaproteobacteria bacterium]
VLLPVLAYVSPKLAVPVLATPSDTLPIDVEPGVADVLAPVTTLPLAPAKQPVATRQDSAPTLQPLGVALALYVAGAMAVLLHLLSGVVRLRRITRHAVECDSNEIWANARQFLNSRQSNIGRVQIKTSAQIHSPVMWGASNPVILMPVSAGQWSEADRRSALLHEMAHVERGDWLTRILARVACALNWFNPLVWVAANLLNSEAEHAADDRVLAAGSRPDDYAQQLVALTRNARTEEPIKAAGLPMATKKLLSRRVAAVLNTGENRMPMTTFARFALFANITLVAMIIAATQPVAAGNNRETSITWTDGQAYDVPALHVAVAAGDYALVVTLIETGADINATMSRSFGPYQRSALGTAARAGHLALAELLIDEGADVDRVVSGDATALIEALRGQHLPVARMLVARGANVNRVVRGDGSPMIAAAATGNTEAVKFLLDQGAKPNRWVEGDENPLYHTARSGNVDILQMLIDAGVDVNRAIRGDGNALIVAARHGNDEVADALVKAGARGDLGVDGDGNALMAAAGAGNVSLLQKMIDSGANVNAAVSGDGSALITAARNRQIDAARLLIESGADVNQFVMGDETPLIGAAWRGNTEMVSFLLSAGADASYQAQTPEGEMRSALSQATRAGHKEVIALLKAAGATK